MAVFLLFLLLFSSVLFISQKETNSERHSSEMGAVGGTPDFNVNVCMGDSITEGAFLPEYTSYPDILGRFIDGKTYNSGIGGQTTSSMVARFKSDVLAHHPARLFLLGGTNDIFQRATAANIETNLRKMIDAGLNAGAKVFLLTIPPDNKFTGDQNDIKTAVNAWISAQVSNNVTVVDIHAPMANGSKLFAAYDNGDGVHPNELGMSIIAKTIVQAGQARGQFNSTKFWVASEDGNSSDPSNWAGGAAPVSGDHLVFDSSSARNCTFDRPLTYASISTLPTFAGIINMATDVRTTGDQVLLGGTLTGSTSYIDTCGGHFVQLEANITSNRLSLIMNGDDKKLQGSSLNFFSLVLGNTSIMQQVNITHHLVIKSGAVVDNVAGLVWTPSICGSEFNNDGQITGSGSFVLQLNETNVAAVLGAIECSITISLANGATAPRSLTLEGEGTLGNLTIQSDSPTYECILDLAGFKLDVANITVGERGALVGGDVAKR